MNERTPFQNHLNITNVTPTQAADEITCQIGGTLRATVKNINLTPSDMIKLLTQLPANCHIISVEVSQFHHAESSEGDMYNSVKIDYQTDELMTKTPDPGVNIRGMGDSPFGLGPNIVLCEYNQGKSDTAKKAAMLQTALHGDQIPSMNFDNTKGSIDFIDLEKSIMRAAVHKEQPGMYHRFVGITKAGVMKPVMSIKELDADIIVCVYDTTNMTRLKVEDVKRLLQALTSTVHCSHATTDTLSFSDIDIDYVIAKFEQLKVIANVMGYHIKTHLNDAADMQLHHYKEFPDRIVPDRD